MDLVGALSAFHLAISGILGAVFNLDQPGHFLDWWHLHISVANLVVILLMMITFLAAILLPFPGHRSAKGSDDA